MPYPHENFLVASESLEERINNYLPSQKVLAEHLTPDTKALQERQITDKKFPGAKYSLIYSTVDGKQNLVPPYYPLNDVSIFSHSLSYGSGVFEGIRVVKDKDGEINIILFDTRVLGRLPWSLKGRNMNLPIPLTEYAQGIFDMIAVQGEDILTGPNGDQNEAYLRPIVVAGINGISIVKREGTPIIPGAIANYMPSYFVNAQGVDEGPEIYHGEGAEIVGLPYQRLEQVTGKHASNYADADVIGTEARKYGHEGMLFAPYKINPDTSGVEPVIFYMSNDVRTDMVNTPAADCTGEELGLIVENILYIPPMDVNRLGGTVLDFYATHMAPHLGLRVEERPFTPAFIEKMKKIHPSEVNLMMFGNAVRIAPAKALSLRDFNGKEFFRVEFNPKENAMVRASVDQWEGQTTRRYPSHPSLLTRVPQSAFARRVLDNAFSNWK